MTATSEIYSGDKIQAIIASNTHMSIDHILLKNNLHLSASIKKYIYE